MPCTVLLVDDEPNVLTGLQRVLRKEPYELLSAHSADEAFDILRARPVDVIVSDQDMPGMLGTEFLTKVQQEFPDTTRFILTGKSNLEATKHVLENGIVSQCLTKPCSRVDLTEAIRKSIKPQDIRSTPAPAPAVFTGQFAVLEQIIQAQPEVVTDLLTTMRYALQKNGIEVNTQHVPNTNAHHMAELIRLAREHPAALVEMLRALYKLLLRRGLQAQAQLLMPRHRPSEEGSQDASAGPSPCAARPSEESPIEPPVPPEHSFESCLHQLRLSAESGQEYPGVMKLVRDERGLHISTLGNMPFEDCRLLCAKVQEVFLVRLESGKVVRAKLDSIHRSFLIVDTERSAVFSKQGERLFLVFPVPPYGHYIWHTWVESVYFKRLKLGYKTPQS